MKKSRLKDWLEALRSGKYVGCRGALRRNDAYCSLGVLCDISGLGSWEKDNHSDKYKYLKQVKYLPQEVIDWAGMSREEYGAVSAFVMVYNDSQLVGLSEMADLLDKRYKKS